MNHAARRMLKVFAVVLCCLPAYPAGTATAEPVTTDLWDVSRGAAVTAHSGTTGLSSPANMFGGTSAGSAEPMNTLFRDDQLAGFVHFVEWRAPVLMELTGFNLFAIHDGAPFDANERGFRRFSLYAKNPDTLSFEPIFEYFPTNPYTLIGPGFLLVSTDVPPVMAQEFRAEFEQFGDRTPTARGPRIVELDGFGNAIPEPATLTLLGVGALSLVGYGWRRRKRVA